MKKQLFIPAILALAVFATGCSNITDWNQDPLKGRDALKNGENKPSEPIGQKPIGSDAVRIRAEDYVSFKEQRADEFTITGQVLLKDYTYTLTVVNMADFPGATFDASSGLFKWTPAKGTVADGEYSGEKTLTARIVAMKTGSPVLVSEKNIVIGVARVFNAPEIVSVNKNQDKLRENETMIVKVKVRDNDAVAGNKATWPVIQLTNVISGKSLINFVAVDNMQFTNGLFDLTLRVDLKDAELTKDSELYSFGIRAVSKFNQNSNEQRVDITVLTSITDAVTTWTNIKDAKAGETIDHSFMIFDPKGEAAITVKEFTNLPQGALASCTRVSSSVLTCGFFWATTPLTVANGYNIIAKVESKNADSSDSFVKNQDLPLRVKITGAAPVSTSTEISGGR